MKQTAVEFLAEKYDYVNWMRNRDEISSGMADEWRKHYLERAKAMEKEQIIESYCVGCADITKDNNIFPRETSEQYYNETFKSE